MEKKTYHISSLEEVKKNYNEVITHPEIKSYRCIGGGRFSLGYDAERDCVIKREGEYYFDNPNFVESVEPVEPVESVEDEIDVSKVPDAEDAEDIKPAAYSEKKSEAAIKPQAKEEVKTESESVLKEKTAELMAQNAALKEELDAVKKHNAILSQDIENIMISVRTIKNLFASVENYNFK